MIRPASSDDAAAIAEIWNAIIRDTAITFTDQQKTVEDIRAMIAMRDVLVAVQGDETTGFATFGPFRPGPGYVRVAEHSIYLAEPARGQGIGRALMVALEALARDKGLRALIAGIGGEATGSCAFHTRLGFEQVGHLPQVGWKFGRAHDLILMQKLL